MATKRDVSYAAMMRRRMVMVKEKKGSVSNVISRLQTWFGNILGGSTKQKMRQTKLTEYQDLEEESP
jgi:hypothetical protein